MELKNLFQKYFDIGHNMVCLHSLSFSRQYKYICLSGGVYLLGGTNAGKSSLFNSLIDSDLCHIHALDCIQRATVSNLPGKGTIKEIAIFSFRYRYDDECTSFSNSITNWKKSIYA